MDVGDTVGIVATCLGILALMGTGLVWLIRNVVRDEIKKATMPIPPGYRTGGESLADLAQKIDRIIARMENT